MKKKAMNKKGWTGFWLVLLAGLMMACSTDDMDMSYEKPYDNADMEPLAYDGSWHMATTGAFPYTVSDDFGNGDNDSPTQVSLDGTLRIYGQEMQVKLPSLFIMAGLGVPGIAGMEEQVCQGTFLLQTIGYSEDGRQTIFSVKPQNYNVFALKLESGIQRVAFHFNADLCRLVVNNYADTVQLWLNLTGVTVGDTSYPVPGTDGADMEFNGYLKNSRSVNNE